MFLYPLMIVTALATSPSNSRMAGVVKASPNGLLTLDKGEVVKLAGVQVSNTAKARTFFNEFLVGKVVIKKK